MDIAAILEKQKIYQAEKERLPELTVKSYEKAFEVEYAHNSTAIEGNTLTLMETKVVLEDEVAIGGKLLREIYEVVNHKKAYRYVKECIRQGLALNEKIVKDIHALLMENILTGGIYRREEVAIRGAGHTPPSGDEIYSQIKNFYTELAEKNHLNGVELAAWTHAKFVRIHPFVDGNGRTARLLMNYQLLANDFLPISIAKEARLDYYNALDRYAVTGELDELIKMTARLEERQLNKCLSHICG